MHFRCPMAKELLNDIARPCVYVRPLETPLWKRRKRSNKFLNTTMQRDQLHTYFRVIVIGLSEALKLEGLPHEPQLSRALRFGAQQSIQA
jgi:hypothetical protein